MSINSENTNPWIDISQPLSNEVAHWPGDTPFTYEVSVTKEESGSVNIGKITTSTHTGTHIDAPFHFIDNGKKIMELDLTIFIGRCIIIDVSPHYVLSEEVFKQYDLKQLQRLLIKTSVPNNPSVFPGDIPYITESGAKYLNKKGVKLVGVDVPSVDKLDSKELKGHHALYNHKICILENVMLDHVQTGEYELIALPLALVEADGSPVRAVIRKI